MAGLDEAASTDLLRSIDCVASIDGSVDIQKENEAVTLFGADYCDHE